MALELINGCSKGKIVSNNTVNCEIEYPLCMNSYLPATPPFSKEVASSGDFLIDETGKKVKLNFNHGTTTLGFVYKNGILLTVDSRATSGEYIGSGNVKKIIEINDYLLGTMAGGAADCVYWERVLAKQCRIYELRNRERISVAAASKLLSNMVYQYKGYGLCLGVMIAGWDKKGAALYYVDNDGSRLPGKLFSVGSGSPNAYSVADSGYHYDMSDEEAQDLGRRAVYHATHRDGASGGIIRVYHITADGWKKISEDDCNDLHYKYKEEKKVATI